MGVDLRILDTCSGLVLKNFGSIDCVSSFWVWDDLSNRYLKLILSGSVSLNFAVKILAVNWCLNRGGRSARFGFY